MINLQSSNKQILDELFAEQNKALYWLIKKNGGQKSYEKMRDRILLEAMSLKKDVFTEGVEYISPNGNRWMVFECASYYPDARAANTHTYAFCFYKTLGGMGVFVPVRISDSEQKAVLIFTSHFFKRMEERLGIQYDSPKMLFRFHLNIAKMILQYNKEDNNIQIRMPDAIGLGVMKKGEGFIFEVRTILSDYQLNNRQLRKTENIRTSAEKINHEPFEIAKIRMKKSLNDKEDLMNEMEKIAKHYQALGEGSESIHNRMEVYMWIGFLFHRMGYIDENDDNFLRRFGIVNKNLLQDYVKNKTRNIENFIDLCVNCFREMNLKSFDQEKAKKILMDSGGISENGILLSPITNLNNESV